MDYPSQGGIVGVLWKVLSILLYFLKKTDDLTLTFLTLIHLDEGVVAQGSGPKKGAGFNNQIAQQVKSSDMIYHLTKIIINEREGGGKPDISTFKIDLSDVNSILSNVAAQPPHQDID